MAAPRPLRSCLVFLCFAGCASSTPPKRTYDLAYTLDFAGDDLSGELDGGVDLEPGPDMSRVGWTNKSYSTTASLWTVWSNGSGLVVAGGDGSLLLKSTGGAFAVDGSTKPSGTSNLLSLYAAPPGPPTNPLYVAGQNGLIWSNSGNLATGNGTWTAETSGASSTLYGVFVDSAGTGFAVGTNTALKRSGSATWSALTGVDTNLAFGLWGTKTGSGDVAFTVGHDENTPGVGLIWKSTGTNFVAETSVPTANTLYAAWGSSPTDIYAVGDKGTILHSTGNGTWTAQTSPVTTALEGIYGVSANEIYIVGDSGVLLHKYDAASATWTQETNLPASIGSNDLYAVWANASAVWAVGSNGTIITK